MNSNVKCRIVLKIVIVNMLRMNNVRKYRRYVRLMEWDVYTY